MPREERREPEEAPGNKVHGDKLRDIEPGKDR